MDYLPRNKSLKDFSRELRKDTTKQENHLWYDYLRTYPLRFNRQRIIGDYIADFYCDKVKLVIEIDGSQHYEDAAIQYDIKRTEYFESIGITVIRFTNRDIDQKFSGVCIMIDQQISLLLKEGVSVS